MNRSAAKKEFKGKKTEKGVFLVHCIGSNRRWVGGSLNLRAAQNRLWFMGKTGGAANSEFASDWAQFGPAAFDFKILESFDPEEESKFPADRLKERIGYWRTQMKAIAI